MLFGNWYEADQMLRGIYEAHVWVRPTVFTIFSIAAFVAFLKVRRRERLQVQLAG